jgi:uncharacterized membrane protein
LEVDQVDEILEAESVAVSSPVVMGTSSEREKVDRPVPTRSPGEIRKAATALVDQPLPFWLSVGLALGFGTLYGRLGVRHYDAFGAWAFDMGIYDQALWKASRFGPTFITVRGLEMWGHHFNPVMYLYAPFYWLGAGPRFLYASQAVIIGLGAIAVYLLARDRLKSPWLGLCFSLAYVGYAPIGFITWANWHPEALVITPLLFAWWAARRHSWRMFAVFALLALTTREDAALVMTMMGALLMWHAWRDVRSGDDPVAFGWGNRNVRASVLTLVGSLALYFFATKGVIRHYNDGKDPFYIQYFYGDFGSTMFGVLGSMLRHPDRVVNLAMKPDRVTFYFQLLLPLAATPLAGFPYLVMAGPQMLSSITSSTPYARSIDYQYPSMMIAPILIASIEGVARRIKKGANRRWMMAVLLVCAYVSNTGWSNSPIGVKVSYWNAPTARSQVLERAVGMVPDTAGVAATYAIVPHLTHRNDIYDWPNPWIATYWGNDLPGGGVEPLSHNPNRVTWVVFDRLHLDVTNPNNVRQAALVERLIGTDGEFEVLYEQDGIVVAKRIKTDTPPTIPISVLPPVQSEVIQTPGIEAVEPQ